MFLKKIGLFTILCLVFGQLVAQQDDAFFYGKLSDATTGEPVVFATIRVKGKALGIISNNDGGFKIPSDFQLKGDTLVISSMGYETKQVGFAALRKNSVNQILIKPSVLELAETVVTAKKNKRSSTKVKGSLTAEKIIAYAIERIPTNYDKNPFEMVGYYRDYQLKEKKYTNLNEALIKVFDKGFDVEDYTSLQFGLYNYKTNLDFKIDSFAAKPYDYLAKDKYIPDAEFNTSIVPNELVQLFNHDAIRNNNEPTYSYVNTFVKDFIKEHDFYTFFRTNYGDKKLYKIKFKRSAVPFQVKGDIYIDMDTYAIRKLDYTVYRQKIDNTSPTNYNESEMDLLYEILLEYQNHKDYMYLNYISFHNKFKLIRPAEFFIKDAIFDKYTYELTMILNKPAVNWLTLENKDFKVFYQGNRLKVNDVVRVGDVGDTYVISFLRKGKLQRKNLRLLRTTDSDKEKASFKITVNKMKDAEGNFLGERKSELLDQFREFFTQRIISNGNNEADRNFYVDKKVSLGNEKQPNISVKTDEEFWMNTPLKSSQN